MLPAPWREFLGGTQAQEYLEQTAEFLTREICQATVYPPREEWFTAFRLTPPEEVRAVILGQDPYHEEGQAHGLAFSVPAGVQLPPSLRNIFKELESDTGIRRPASGDLTEWAKNGMLLLNTVLTVRAGEAGSHAGRGWENFTDTVIKALSASASRRVFIFWGAWAGKKSDLVETPRNPPISPPHPSPLSASRGFFGSCPFSKCNGFLTSCGLPEIPWGSLPIQTEQMELEIL